MTPLDRVLKAKRFNMDLSFWREKKPINSNQFYIITSFQHYLLLTMKFPQRIQKVNKTAGNRLIDIIGVIFKIINVIVLLTTTQHSCLHRNQVSRNAHSHRWEFQHSSEEALVENTLEFWNRCINSMWTIKMMCWIVYMHGLFAICDEVNNEWCYGCTRVIQKVLPPPS